MSERVGEIIEVTRGNFVDLAEALQSLRLNHDRLVKAQKRYPLVCEFADYRFVFDQEGQVAELTATLDAKLSAYAHR